MQPSCSAFVKPPRGDPLVLNEGVTWIGRGSFSVSTRAQLLCSRRQACLKLAATGGLVLECHGINPLLFVVCHSRAFHGTEETPAAELFQVRKGEAVGLTDGDQFYFAAMECLLTVVIRQKDIPTSRDALELPLQQASEAYVKERERGLQDVEILGPAEDCGTGKPHRFLLKNDPAMCAYSPEAVAALLCPGVVARPQEFLVGSKPLSNPGSDCRLSEITPRDGSVRTEQEDSDFLGLDAYDCAALGVRPFRREEIQLDPAVEIENANSAEISESHQTRAENCIEDALTSSSTVNKGPEEVKYPNFSIDGEGCRPLNNTLENLPSEAFARGQGESQDFKPIMSSETVDGRSIEEGLLLSEPVRDLAFGNVGDCLSSYSNPDLVQASYATLTGSHVSGIRNECPEKLEEWEHLEVSGRANDKDDDPFNIEDEEAWPDGPVEGMESVIVSVSGYEGVDKQNLVKLINKTGAAFTGVFSNANTHLVCRSFHGKKFDSAMKLHKVVVNHQWFQDCLRAGKRLSEGSYRLRSGEDVGPLKWKETPPPPVKEQAEASNGASNQHPSDHGAFFWNTIGEEGNMDQQGQDAAPETAYQKDLLGPSRVANLGAGHTRVRKSRRLIKRSGLESRIDSFTVEQENLVGENLSAPTSNSGRAGESYQRRTGESVGGLEQDNDTRHRKSASSALHAAGQVQRHHTKGRNSVSSRPGRGNAGLDQGAASTLRDNLTHSSVARDREFTVLNFADEVDDNVREIGSRIHLAASAQAVKCTNAETSRDRSLQDSQSSQGDSGVACVICRREAKSPSEGLLECGHKFCYHCIFTWTKKAELGPRCPLCKAQFVFITRLEVSSSGKLDETVVVVDKKEIGPSIRTQRTVALDHVCIQCGNSDSESLLMRCGTCGNRAIHNFCMDPPVPPPWYCPGCTDGHQRDSLRLAWNQFLPGPSTTAYAEESRPSNVRRRDTQSYTVRRSSRSTSSYRPSLHTELMQSMGPLRRRNVVGQHSLRSWLSNHTSNGD